jgi:hypothetical protein
MGNDNVASIVRIILEILEAFLITYILYVILNYLTKYAPFSPYMDEGAMLIYIVFLMSLAFLIAYPIIAMVARVRRGAQW